MFRKIPSFLKNKFFYTALAFIVWMLFFDQNNFISQFWLLSDLREVENEKQYYLQEIENDKKATQELTTDTITLEKFAREKYLMKRDNEDIFLIVREGEK